MLIFVKLLAPVIAGGAVAGAVTFGVVQVQTSAGTERNAESSSVASYGNN